MKIVEQTIRIQERTSDIQAEHSTECLFQVFVKGRLQDRNTYFIKGQTINFGFDCLVPGDLVQLFFLISK
ncbi:MAG: hypothetical protein P4N59_26075 [Negativicutes bacterium]|nr:hypothetical protein [Negativicutes bacterium]